MLTGRLLHDMISAFGLEAVQRFLTGYADDFTLHRTIYSRADLTAAHSMITRLLESVARLQLRVNPSKCVILVKLAGVEAPAIMKRHTCWLPDAQGTLQKCWRLGRNKTFQAFRWESSTKYEAFHLQPSGCQPQG